MYKYEFGTVCHGKKPEGKDQVMFDKILEEEIMKAPNITDTHEGYGSNMSM